MLITHLREVDGAVIVTVPRTVLDLLHLQAGAAVTLAVDGGRLVIEPQARARYTLSELMDASDYSGAPVAEERDWIDAPAVGREQL